MTAIDIDSVKLEEGAHRGPEHGFCVMELASYVAGEPFSDHPQCVSPVIGAFLRRYNDLVDDEARQKLRPFVAPGSGIYGTAGDGKDEARGYLVANWATHVALPVWLELAGATEAAAEVRALAPITDRESARAAAEVTRPIRNLMWKKREELFEPLRAKVREAVEKALAEKENATTAAAATTATTWRCHRPQRLGRAAI